MATIESLDLATLTNNPQSIAEALEDVLEVSSGNIASLKSTAQTDQQYITNTLKPAAQADADTLSDLVDDAPTADVLTLDLSVTDRSSKFSIEAGWNGSINAHSFQSLMFFNAIMYHSGGSPNHTETVIQINDSDFYPDTEYGFPTQGFQGDTSHYLTFLTTGEIKIYDPENVGSSTYYLNVNGYYAF